MVVKSGFAAAALCVESKAQAQLDRVNRLRVKSLWQKQQFPPADRTHPTARALFHLLGRFHLLAISFELRFISVGGMSCSSAQSLSLTPRRAGGDFLRRKKSTLHRRLSHCRSPDYNGLQLGEQVCSPHRWWAAVKANKFAVATVLHEGQGYDSCARV